MHLVKWFRKNMGKLMAVFVILIMIAFIMPSVLSQLAKPRSSGPTKAMWYYYGDKKITPTDIERSSRELIAMRNLYVDRFLLGQQDLRFILLGQVLFPESVQGAMLSDRIKGFAIRSRLCISPQQVDNFFQQASGKAEFYWILLKAEAANAGCTVSPKQAGAILNSLIPKITDNRIDAQTAVRNAAAANGMTDDTVLATFADIMSVTTYARMVTDMEDVTEAQVAFSVEIEKETINAKFVQFDNDTFIEKESEPAETQIEAQFEKYKNDEPNVITDENPFGFGYKQPPRVALEYMIIKLDDAKKLVPAITEEEAEDFYQQNLKLFTEKIPENINDPNSKVVERQQSYAEVADNIKRGLLTKKASTKAVKILEDAVDQAQAGFDSLNPETAAVEQLKEKTIDYAVVAEKLEKQNDLKIYAGKTAPLAGDEILQDKCLGSLAIRGQSKMPTELVRMAFSVQQLGKEAYELGPFEPAKPQMFVSFGPLADNMAAVVAVVRVIEAKNSTVPDINFSYERNLPSVFQDQDRQDKTFVLREQVKEDLLRLAAFETVSKKANEFAALAKDKGWDTAIEKFNSLYPARPSKSANDGNEVQKTFEIQIWNNRSRISLRDLEVIKLGASQTPAAAKFVNQTEIREKLMDAFYSLLKSNEIKLENTPAVVEFKPLFACYVIKSLQRNPATMADYEQLKQQNAYREDYEMAQSMAIEFFMPNNIMKRLNVKPVEAEPNQPLQQTEANTNGA